MMKSRGPILRLLPQFQPDLLVGEGRSLADLQLEAVPRLLHLEYLDHLQLLASSHVEYLRGQRNFIHVSARHHKVNQDS